MELETDRRCQARVLCVELAAYSGRRRGQVSTPVCVGKTLDLSESGVRLQVSTGVEEGDLVELDIAVGEELILARARVIHVELIEGGLQEVGAEFTDFFQQGEALLRQHLQDHSNGELPTGAPISAP